MSYLEYIDKLSESKQTIVGYGDALSALGNLFVLLGKLALVTVVVGVLAMSIALVAEWFIEKLISGMSRLFESSIGINSDVLLTFMAMVGILGSFAILNSIGFMGALSNETDEKPITHSDSLVLLHNDLVNWNDS